MATQQAVRRFVALAVRQPPNTLARDDAIDRVALHPLWGMLLLAATLFLMFQAVFSWAAWPIELIKDGVAFLSDSIRMLVARHRALAAGLVCLRRSASPRWSP